MSNKTILIGSLFCSLVSANPVTAAETARDVVATRLCAGLAARMDGSVGPFLFRSYEPGEGGQPLDPALENAAFTYDNALASIALFACRQDAKALRVADALRLAVDHDRHYRDGRIRNAYRSGAVTDIKEPMLLPGFWNARLNAWIEDDYQVGTATGNVAWTALALLAAHEQSRDQTYRATAARLVGWIDTSTKGKSGVGYAGGTFGQEPAPTTLDWKSTEHNLDIYAAANWLAAIDDTRQWKVVRDQAGSFLDAMWNEREGRFYVGSLPGSDLPNTSQSGIDSELWPLLAVPEFEGRASRVLNWVDRHYAVNGGFDFNDDRDGVWLEGTAQAALTFQRAGQKGKADRLLETIKANISPSGLVYATQDRELTTGLKIGPGSNSADFKYFRLPHIGATAWAILAAKDWNPFTGNGVAPALLR